MFSSPMVWKAKENRQVEALLKGKEEEAKRRARVWLQREGWREAEVLPKKKEEVVVKKQAEKLLKKEVKRQADVLKKNEDEIKVVIVEELKKQENEVKQQIEEELQNQEEDTKRKDPYKIEDFEAAPKTSKEQEVARRQNEELLNKLTVFIFFSYLTYDILLWCTLLRQLSVENINNNFANDHEQTN